jgi:DNA-binding SARP family transcriptional activator
VFNVIKEGELIQFSGKAQRKPLDLLKILIAFGAKSVDINLIMSCLWPDAPGDAAQKSFDTTLYRLRKLLSDDAITLTNRCVSLNPKMCWVDVWETEQIVSSPFSTEADALNPDLCGGGLIKLDRLFDLYKGNFLCFEETQQWVISPADRLKSKFIRFVKNVGDRLAQKDNWREAVNVFRKGIEVDGLSEDLYRALMESQRRVGNVADALETYRRCRQMLSVVLGISPSEATTAIYRELMRENMLGSHGG